MERVPGHPPNEGQEGQPIVIESSPEKSAADNISPNAAAPSPPIQQQASTSVPATKAISIGSSSDQLSNPFYTVPEYHRPEPPLHIYITTRKKEAIYTWLDKQPDHPEQMSSPADLGLEEKSVRLQAIQWMERTYRDLPNGSEIEPPTWYRWCLERNDRPTAWIKDWDDGEVRPMTEEDDEIMGDLMQIDEEDEMMDEDEMYSPGW
ncbi:hypothetical protein B0T20DRAFT_476398 [Sordaria brevicollis]|uniref:Uncharacterized protein n=1 Tax=Sordaria brevicollis TaxID=83679 RepID=A0AAE0UFV4_SORBR|nr:hypothetical protein B0T20DRAFT_476398 [Sordaria brevicollis]